MAAGAICGCGVLAYIKKDQEERSREGKEGPGPNLDICSFDDRFFLLEELHPFKVLQSPQNSDIHGDQVAEHVCPCQLWHIQTITFHPGPHRQTRGHLEIQTASPPPSKAYVV